MKRPSTRHEAFDFRALPHPDTSLRLSTANRMDAHAQDSAGPDSPMTMEPVPGGLQRIPEDTYTKQYVLDTLGDWLQKQLYLPKTDIEIQAAVSLFSCWLGDTSHIKPKPSPAPSPEDREYFARDAFLGRIDPATSRGKHQQAFMKDLAQAGGPGLQTQVKYIEAFIRDGKDRADMFHLSLEYSGLWYAKDVWGPQHTFLYFDESHYCLRPSEAQIECYPPGWEHLAHWKT